MRISEVRRGAVSEVLRERCGWARPGLMPVSCGLVFGGSISGPKGGLVCGLRVIPVHQPFPPKKGVGPCEAPFIPTPWPQARTLWSKGH